MGKEKIYVFDAYGTLFDVDSACRNLKKQIGKDWNNLSIIWRQKQLEYSWLRNSINEYISFWEITKNSLEFAMKTVNINDEGLKKKLLNLYFEIESYEEVEAFLIKLKKLNFKTCILSNGSFDMLKAAISNSNLNSKIDKVLSVESCKKFKPSSEVYKLVVDEFNVNKNEIIFFSSNSWDVHGASIFGFKTVWVNRLNKVDDLLPGIPNYIVKRLKDYII
tara:strand:+ start:37 stop:696 length:660 start_codon:yes stop_codon:yes gene_type:complete